MAGNGREDETRERLIEAAGEIFSSKGYQAATVREITKAAKANLAAIHYHFGSKDRLYQAVLEHAHREAARRFPPDPGLPAGTDPAVRLYAFVRASLLRLEDKQHHAWLGRLMAREMAEPSSNLAVVVDRCLAPTDRVLREIVGELLGPEADPLTVACHCRSIVGQCRHFVLDAPLISRLYPDCDPGQGGVTAVALHIVRFSLAALGHPEARTFVPPLSESVRGDVS